MVKKIFSLFALIIGVTSINAQVFWTEDFGLDVGCSNQNQNANGAVTTNGTWNVVSLAAEGGQSNLWFISATEAGMGAGNCGDGCLGTPALDNQTLHLGSVAVGFCVGGDCGAAYNAGGTGETHKRVESPVINCTGQSTITISFDYMHFGETGTGTDEGSLWYFDGTTWSVLQSPMPQTSCCGGPCGGLFVQGQWSPTQFSIPLPASANNNPNVQIGFRWDNDANNSGADPSFAIDNITLSTPNTGPTASFSSSDSTICVGDCINFSDLSTGAPIAWTWYFPGSDSATSTQQNPTNICYNSAGSFDVSLVVDDGSNTDSLHIPNFITVSSLPVVIANASVNPICSGDSVTLSGGGASSYTWDNGVNDGVAFSPGSTTLYTVTGTDANNCQNTDTITVFVNSCGAPPVASFSATDSSICVGDCIDFNDLSTGAPTGWTWYFFGAATTSSSSQNPTNICYNSAGSFDVALVSTNANGQDSLFIAGFITVNALPTVTANSTNTTICAGDQITLTGSGANSYTWNNGAVDGVAFTPAATTTYTVTGTDANGCIDTNSIIITVNPCNNPPIANLSSSINSICIDECVDFTDLSSGGTPTNWTWYFFGANPATSSNQNPTNICYDSTGTYSIALSVSNAFGQDSIYFANYITVDSCNSNPTSVIIPNVFSPNGDGHNDLFYVSGTGIISVTAEIYNRWGSLLFSSEELVSKGWDGRTTSGSLCSEGTYFYIISVETANENETYKGTLTLIR